MSEACTHPFAGEGYSDGAGGDWCNVCGARRVGSVWILPRWSVRRSEALGESGGSRRRCSKCGRSEPEFIASPYCPSDAGGYCDWRSLDGSDDQNVVVTYEDLLPFERGSLRRVKTPPGFVLQNTFLTDSGGITGSMLICVWTREPGQ